MLYCCENSAALAINEKSANSIASVFKNEKNLLKENVLSISKTLFLA
jgi:hypothetical protein